MALTAAARRELREADADQIAAWLGEFLDENKPDWITIVEGAADSTSIAFRTADGRRWVLQTEEP